MSEWYPRAVFGVADIARALEFYVDRLGFTRDWSFDEVDVTRVAQVSRQGCDLILGSQWPERVGKGLMFISLDEPVLDALRTELEGRGVEVKDGWWGYKLMVVVDPDGNELFFPYPNESSGQEPS